MRLVTLDWIIVLVSIVVSFLPAVILAKRAGSSTAEFFTSGRSAPWWLVGVSMVATTFSTDTPNLVTNLVREKGVANNWAWWSFLLTGMMTVFFYARLWRRSNVLTDLEFYEIRYSGRASTFVRGFRAVYLGLFFNCVIMASVNLAAAKIANVMLGWPMWQTLLICAVLNVAFAATSGLWGVLVTDFIQFGIAMAGAFAAAYYSLQQPEVGGSWGCSAKLPPQTLHLLPDFNDWGLTLSVLIIPLTVQWWSVWYPGAEPGGGSYIAQRMLASKSENDALAGTLFFNFAHYAIRPWPWIITGLCSILVFPELSDIARTFPYVDPKLIGHDMAYPAMLKFLPAGFMGLMIAGMLAAYVSTISTHLNWGTSYLVHDVYRRFVKEGASEAHYVMVGTPRHGAAHGARRRAHLRSRLGAPVLRTPHVHRRRHRAAVPAALVLVARERMVRDRGDGHIVPHRAGLLRRRQGGDGRSVAHHPHRRRGHHDRRVGDDRVPRPAHRFRQARFVLRARAPGRARVEGRPRSHRAPRLGRLAADGDARMGPGLRLRLRGTVRRRELPVRQHGPGAGVARRLCGEHRRAGAHSPENLAVVGIVSRSSRGARRVAMRMTVVAVLLRDGGASMHVLGR
jgi:Na+/proline symporter